MPENGNGKTETSPPSGVTEKQVRDIVAGVLDSTKGDPQDAMERLVRANERLALEVEQSKKQVPEGGAIISATQVKLLEQYKKLGTPEELTNTVSERDKLQTDVALTVREKSLKSAADAHGYQPALLVRLAMQDNLVVDEIREEGEDDEKTKVAYVRLNEEGAKPVRLDKYAQETWEEFLVGLSTEPASDTTGKRLAPASERGTPTKSVGPVTEETVREKKLAKGQYVRF